MQHGIKYIEKDVSRDPAAAAEMRALGFMGVPSFKIGETTFSGLDIERLLAAIDYKIVNCPACQKKLRVPKDASKLKLTCPACRHNF